MQITRITRKYVNVEIAVTTYTGDPATIDGVDVAVLRRGDTPTAQTTWVPADVHDGTVTFLIAGPDADNGGALPVREDGTDVWGRVTDHPEVDTARLVEITVY